MLKPLLVVGSINADLYVEIARLPAPGETILGGGAAMRPGGKGANQAGAAARLGVTTWFAGRVGEDAYAGPLRGALAEVGVWLDLLQTVPGASGQALILLQQGGENSIIVVPGANHIWHGLDAMLTAQIRDASAVLLQREIPEPVNVAVAAVAHAAGVPVVLDAGGAEGPLPAALLAQLTVLSPNETELARLTNMPTNDTAQVVAAARALQAQGVGTVLVKLGARGALVVDRDGSVITQAIFPVSVIDTTGAGDCFTAAYAVAMVETKAQAERLRFAAAAAGLCIQCKGALPSMPSRAEVEAFLANHP